jgi:hypothetical protein
MRNRGLDHRIQERWRGFVIVGHGFCRAITVEGRQLPFYPLPFNLVHRNKIQWLISLDTPLAIHFAKEPLDFSYI